MFPPVSRRFYGTARPCFGEGPEQPLRAVACPPPMQSFRDFKRLSTETLLAQDRGNPSSRFLTRSLGKGSLCLKMTRELELKPATGKLQCSWAPWNRVWRGEWHLIEAASPFTSAGGGGS